MSYDADFVALTHRLRELIVGPRADKETMQ
jgi:hypothetical protein